MRYQHSASSTQMTPIEDWKGMLWEIRNKDILWYNPE